MYEPLETSKCKKCGKIIAEPKELIRIKKRIEEFEAFPSSTQFSQPQLHTQT